MHQSMHEYTYTYIYNACKTAIQQAFIYTSRDSLPSASFHCNGAPLTTSHDGIAMMALPQ